MEPEKIHPQSDGILMPTLRVGAGCGAAGLLFGGVVGTIRSAHPTLWAIVAAIQWSMLGSSYWGVRSAVLQSRSGEEITPDTKAYISAISGGVSAAFVGAVTRGRANIIPGSIVGSLLGFSGQKGFNYLDKRHTESITTPEAEVRKPFWQRVAASKYSPMRMLSDDDYRKILEDRLLRVDAEIAVIDDNIAALKENGGNSSAERPK